MPKNVSQISTSRLNKSIIKLQKPIGSKNTRKISLFPVIYVSTRTSNPWSFSQSKILTCHCLWLFVTKRLPRLRSHRRKAQNQPQDIRQRQLKKLAYKQKK